jgi:MFS family permease
MSQAAQRTAVTPLRAVAIAWLITSIYYFYQYAMRSAPAVMVPEMSTAFGLTPVGIASLVGLFYYAYAPFSLVAGVAMDQLGPRKVVPVGAATVAIGALLFSTGDPNLASIGRFLQGAGGVFALIGAVYIATTHFPASKAATLIGATQMFGMAGGSAGQFVVGPAISGGLAWDQFWLLMGLAGLPIACLLALYIPSRQPAAAPVDGGENWLKKAGSAMWAVFSNPQSIICGLISGLLFIPTTIFDMVWGVRYLQEGHGMPYDVAVLRSAAVPFGWIIGCPLLGWISDRLGRRKPVIIGGAAVLLGAMAMGLYGPPGMLPPFTIALVAGIASGAAMIPYTVVKEANRPEHSGSATGVINFINFSFSALLGPLFAARLMRISGGDERALGDYQATFMPMLFGIALAILLTFLLRETGPKARKTNESPPLGAGLPAE